jgi:four helix bundle protein
VNYDEWVKSIPQVITADALWKIEAYRLGLLMSDLSWHDATKLMRDKRTLDLSSQLYEAVGSVSANIAEGYSRGSNKDRARFYEYALGSARESRDWYYKGRFVLSEKIADHRMQLLTQIIRLLLTMVPEQRGRTLHEDQAEYRINNVMSLDDLLKEIPLPEL